MEFGIIFWTICIGVPAVLIYLKVKSNKTAKVVAEVKEVASEVGAVVEGLKAEAETVQAVVEEVPAVVEEVVEAVVAKPKKPRAKKAAAK